MTRYRNFAELTAFFVIVVSVYYSQRRAQGKAGRPFIPLKFFISFLLLVQNLIFNKSFKNKCSPPRGFNPVHASA